MHKEDFKAIVIIILILLLISALALFGLNVYLTIINENANNTE